MNGKLSSKLEETLGVKQGSCKASDHYKEYIAPALKAVDSANLGVWVGPINLGVSVVADDFLGMSDDPKKLQCILDLAGYYGKMYRIKYGADKTKVTVVGPKLDQQFYKDTQPWIMDNQRVGVVDNNDHLGQIISGDKQEQKNRSSLCL